jgi:hypothetical protein
MTEDEEVDYLWGLALGKKSGWQYQDYPVVKDKLPKFAEAWKKSKKKTQYKTGKPVDVWMVEQYWIAEARQRRVDREKNVRVSQPVGATVWLNDERWNNGVEAEVQETKKDSKKCKCGRDTHGPKYSECAECMGFKDGKLVSPHADKLRQYATDNNIMKMTRQECIDFIKRNGKKIGHKNILLDKQ